LLGLPFNPQDASDEFLKNIMFSPDCTVTNLDTVLFTVTITGTSNSTELPTIKHTKMYRKSKEEWADFKAFYCDNKTTRVHLQDMKEEFQKLYLCSVLYKAHTDIPMCQTEWHWRNHRG
jgi:hypothetical protein